MSPVSFLEKPVRWLRAITKYQATHIVAPNFAFEICAKKIFENDKKGLDLSTVGYVINAAEPVRMETMRNFSLAFKDYGFDYESFSPCYGLAESTVMVSAKKQGTPPPYCVLDFEELKNNKLVFLSPEDSNGYHLPGCGWSFIGADIKIVNPVTRTISEQDEIGEIWINSKSIAKGYWQKPQATIETFQARIENYEGGPFLRTGDLGFIYEENLYITGRIKDMIIIQGKNYYPQDIELTVEKSHPAVRPGSGAAFSFDDGKYEHLVIVYEVSRKFRKHENLAEVVNSVRMEVAKNHGVRVYAICMIRPSTIQKTTSGKIQRNATRESFLKDKLETLHEWRAPTL
jgi:acyl-CoA synthetase (AMP-forming)/AMP-acid ligase II